MDNPGINGKQFTIYLSEYWYRQEESLKCLDQLKWCWRWIGFYKKHECKILSDPEQINDCWRYKMKITKIFIYWLWFKIKTIEYNG